jgi:hypothetical protein
MIKFLPIVVAVFVLGTCGNAVAEPASQQLPEVSGYTLEGERLNLPADLAAPATLIVIIEEDPFAEDLGSWRELALQLEDEVPAFFLVTMGDKRGLSRSMAAGRLRAEVKDPALRANLVPVFQDGGDLRSSLEIASSSRVSAVLVSRSGDVVWRARGPAGKKAIEEIRSSLRAPLGETQVTTGLSATMGGQAALTIPDVIAPPPTPTSTPPAPAQTPMPMPEPMPEPEPVPVPSAPIYEELTNTPLQMPKIDGVTLAGRGLSMPDDLSKTGTRLVLVADHAGEDVLFAALSEAEQAGPQAASEWYVLLFMGKSQRFGKAVAAGQLRARVQALVWRERIIPVYMELSSFERLAGLLPAVGTRTILAAQSGALSSMVE